MWVTRRSLLILFSALLYAVLGVFVSEAILLTGKRGSGKSLRAVYIAQQYMLRGCLVATNLDLYVEKLVPASNRVRPYRVPDWPTASDLVSLPLGNKDLSWKDDDPSTGVIVRKSGFDEANNGILMLDEASTFLNSRSWNQAGRQAVLDWLAHSRKYGWNLLFLAQHPRQIDAQLRDSLFELVGVMRRLDKMRIPIFSAAASFVGQKVNFFKAHIYVLRYGSNPHSPIAERGVFRGTELYSAYDTTQTIGEEFGVPSGSGYQLLSAWDIRGRYLSWWQRNMKHVSLIYFFGLVCGVSGVLAYQWAFPSTQVSAAVVPLEAAVDKPAKGYFKDGDLYFVILPDGDVGQAARFTYLPDGWRAQVGGIWYSGR